MIAIDMSVKKSKRIGKLHDTLAFSLMKYLNKWFYYTNNLKIAVKTIQIIMPAIVGITAANAVHFKLPVSFFIVISVVEQGQCIREKIIVQIPVVQLHPFATKIFFISKTLVISVKLPCAKYAIIIIGMTISFAGKPRMNAIKITPSSPISFANGSRKSAQVFSRLVSPHLILATSQISNPAGAATAAALPSTNRVRSKIDRTITFPISGRR